MYEDSFLGENNGPIILKLKCNRFSIKNYCIQIPDNTLFWSFFVLPNCFLVPTFKKCLNNTKNQKHKENYIF